MAIRSSCGRLLVVEDPFVRSFVHSYLSRQGYDVVDADVEQGLALLREPDSPIRLLITNQPQPFAEAGHVIPLIYVAASPDESLVGSFSRWRTLEKPFQPSQLLHLVEEMLKPA